MYLTLLCSGMSHICIWFKSLFLFFTFQFSKSFFLFPLSFFCNGLFYCLFQCTFYLYSFLWFFLTPQLVMMLWWSGNFIVLMLLILWSFADLVLFVILVYPVTCCVIEFLLLCWGTHRERNVEVHCFLIVSSWCTYLYSCHHIWLLYVQCYS